MQDLHPIFVHFPVALLTVYAILECVRFKKITATNSWFYIKAVFAILGAVGGLIATQFGEAAERAFRGTDAIRIIEVHSTSADITNVVAGIIAVIYLFAWLYRGNFPALKKAARLFALADRIVASWIMIPLALIALVSITVTGALGGSIIYGSEKDPIVKLIYSVFKLN